VAECSRSERIEIIRFQLKPTILSEFLKNKIVISI